jgi:HEAT repeats/PQQ-like domain
MTRNLGVSLLGILVTAVLTSLCLSMGPLSPSATDEKVLEQAQLGTDPSALLGFFRKRTVSDKDRERVAELIRKLGDDSFEVREKATEDLQALGRLAVPALARAVEDPDLEIARRAGDCLQAIQQSNEQALVLAATHLLVRHKPDEAVSVLLGYLPNAADDRVAEVVGAALEQLAGQDAKIDPALLAALVDRDPARRSAASRIVARHSPQHRPDVRKLLADPDVGVRFAAAHTLATLGDRSAVEPLLALFSTASPEQLWQVEDLLFRLAGDQAVSATLSSSYGAANRQRCQEAWQQWWQANKDKTDLARLTQDEHEVGDRVVCELQGGSQGGGRVFAYGPDDKIRWQFDNVAGPIDVQMQSNGRMLLAEINSNRVTERDRDGKVLWEKKTTNAPMTSQRLANGNVFIATYTELLEVNPEGKTVWSQQKPNLKIYYARKLRNGHILFVTSSGLVIELDAEGKELRSIPAGDTSNWGSVEPLPNGHFLVCRCGKHEVVEIDTAGKEIWRCTAEWPTWAGQLRNGRVLVACAHSGQVIEFDRDSKEVWKQKLTGRPCRIRKY